MPRRAREPVSHRGRACLWRRQFGCVPVIIARYDRHRLKSVPALGAAGRTFPLQKLSVSGGSGLDDFEAKVCCFTFEIEDLALAMLFFV